MNLLPLDNAVLKLKHNGLLTLILTCAASNDLNPVGCAVGEALQEMVYTLPLQKFQLSARTNKKAVLSQRNSAMPQLSTAFLLVLAIRSASAHLCWSRTTKNIVQIGSTISM